MSGGQQSPKSSGGLSPQAWVFVAAVSFCGLAVVGRSVGVLWHATMPGEWLLFAILTVLSGTLSIKIPSIQSRFSVSEVFAFTSVLLFGPDVGALVLSLDGLRISFFWKMNRTQTLFNFANLGLSIWVSARLFFFASGVQPLYGHDAPPATIVFYLALMTGAYFVINSGLTATAIAMSTRRAVLATWIEHYWPLLPSYLAGASVALLLVLAFREVQFTAIALILPLLLICYLTLRSSYGRLEDAKEHVAQLNRLLLSTVETLATAIDAKDEVTHDHVRRVQRGTIALARTMGVTDALTLQAIEAAALLHDTGKIAVPEHILNKPGKLTPAEFEKMKRHAPIGADILSSIEFPYPVVPIVRHHHENWDGTGYPDRLKEDAIPLGARILSVVDCFDALTSDRPYRRRMTDDQAIAILRERRGVMYDPAVVDAFVADYKRIMPDSHATPHPASRAIGDARALDREERAHDSSVAVEAGVTDGLLAVTSLSRALTGEARVADVGALLWTVLRQVLPCDTMAIFVPDVETDEVTMRYAAGIHAGAMRGLRRATGEGIAGWCAVNLRPAVNADPSLDLGLRATEFAPLRSCLAVPLIDGEDLVAVLSLHRSQRDGFSEDDVRLVELLAPRVAASFAAAVEGEENIEQPAPLARQVLKLVKTRV
ncbi:MAG TPA: HD domain-containing phosphohydrolase [Vicinamibacterales bacterium]|nr:HD domain-containing phosphohydrolase [Vicinamibacterales bacterium]